MLFRSEGLIVEQVIRPTGVLDPIIEIRPCTHQVDDLLKEISNTVTQGDRILVTTLTKRMAEELSAYLVRLNIRCRYLHSDIDTLERVEILRQLRIGLFDVLIGINLLREGLDLPEVALVAILDADKEGFLRNAKSLIHQQRTERHYRIYSVLENAEIIIFLLRACFCSLFLTTIKGQPGLYASG